MSRKQRVPALLVLLAAVLAALLVGAYLGGRHLWATYHFRAAQRALEQRDFLQAQAHLRQCLKVWKHHPETHFLAARTARRAGLFDEATELLDTCENLQGASQTVVLERILLNAQRGNLDAFADSYLWALINQDHPATPLILEALSQVYMYQYRLDSALRCLDRWLQLQPDAVPALLWRAQIMQGLEYYHLTLSDLRRALELDPDCDEARLQLAKLLLFLGREKDAAEHFEHLRDRQPGNPAVLLGLARCRYNLGRMKEAEQLLGALIAEHPGHVAALREQGRMALETGRDPEAETWLRQCLAVDPNDRDALYLFYLYLERRGRHDEAKEYQARLERIRADLQRLKELARLVTDAPHDPALRHEAGVICLRNGKEEEGLRWLAGALQIDPGHRPTHQALADYYQRKGQRDLAAYHQQRGKETSKK